MKGGIQMRMVEIAEKMIKRKNGMGENEGMSQFWTGNNRKSKAHKRLGPSPVDAVA